MYKRSSYFFIIFLSILTLNAFAAKKFLIVANGEWDEKIVRYYMSNRITIALDGAAEKFHQHSLFPHFILGDFDSIQEKKEKKCMEYFNLNKALEYFNAIPLPADNIVKFEEYKTYINLENKESIPITYIRAYSQEYTDLSKGVQFCLKQREGDEFLDIIIIGAFGGSRIDLFLNNFTILKKYKSPEFPNLKIRMLNELQIVEFLRDERVEFVGNIGDKFGLFGFSQAQASSYGLKWELDNFLLKIGEKSSACNELKGSRVSIKIKGEALMVRPNSKL